MFHVKISLIHKNSMFLIFYIHFLTTKLASLVVRALLASLVVRALERYSKDSGSSPGVDTCFSRQ